MLRSTCILILALVLALPLEAHEPPAPTAELPSPSLEDCAWPCEDPSLPLELEIRGSDDIPSGIEWELVSTTPEATFYRQTFQGLAITDTQLVDLPTTPWKRYAYRVYPLDLLKAHFGNGPIPLGDSQAALDAAEALWPGAELAADLEILPLRSGPKVIWRIENRGPAGSPGDGSTLLVEASSGLPMAIQRPQVWSVGEVPRGSAPCPDAGRFDDGRGLDWVGDLRCIPVDHIDDPVLDGRIAILRAPLVADGVTIKTYYPDREISIVEARFPRDEWLPRTLPMGTGTLNNHFRDRFPEAVGAQYFLFQTFDFWKRSSLRPLLFPRADGEIRAVTRVAYGSAFWSPEPAYFGFPSHRPEDISLNAVGHEYAHALSGRTRTFTQDAAKIANESVADFLALMVESGVTLPAGSSDPLPIHWLIGAGIQGQPPIRDLSAPQEAGTLSHFWQFPQGGRPSRCWISPDPPSPFSPHSLSTILSHAFYLMAEGGHAVHDALCPAPAVTSPLSFEEVGRIAFWMNYHGISDALVFENLLSTLLEGAESVGLGGESPRRTIEQAMRAVGLPDRVELSSNAPRRERDLSLPRYFEMRPHEQWDPVTMSLFIRAKSSSQDPFRLAIHQGLLPDLSRCAGDSGPGSPYCYAFDVANAEGESSLLLPLNPLVEQLYLVVDPGHGTLAEVELELLPLWPLRIENHEQLVVRQPPQPGAPETFKFELQAASELQDLRVAISGGSGNADLYLKRGSVPTPRDFDFGSPVAGNTETLIIEDAPPGSWYIALYPKSDFADVTLRVDHGAAPPLVSRPDDHFPTYRLGDVARLEVRTDPPQPGEIVYGWRLFNGELERNGEPLVRVDDQGHHVARVTDEHGVLSFELPIPPDAFGICGQYSGERFAVGSPAGLQSAPLEFVVECPGGGQSGGVVAVRPDGHFPSYRLGDTAELHLSTFPPRPGERVYGWRLKDGVVERDGVVLQYDDAEGRRHDYLTDDNGELSIELTLSDPAVCGSYSGEQFAVGDPESGRSEATSFVVDCSTP